MGTPQKKPAKRRCKGRNKGGKRCGAAPLKNSGHCRAHDPTVPEETRFGTPEQAGAAGASPKPARKLTTVLLRKLDEHAEELIERLLEATRAEKGVLVGSGDDASVEMIPDHPTRIRAVAELYDRAEGKPKQATEITGRDGGPIQTEAVPDYADPKVREAADVLLGRSADSEE